MATLSLLTLPKQLLFDGLSDAFYDYVYSPPPGSAQAAPVAMEDIYDNYLNRLLPLIGKETFSRLLVEGDFIRYSDEYSFKGSDRLSLKFYLHNELLLVFALGEFQPERYKIYLEGSWQVAQG